MNRFLRFYQSALLALASCAVLTSASAATLTITPAAVTNDYVGKIALTITGLSSGQSLFIQRFYDLNTNGVVDPGEWAIRSFKVTDGQVPVIGGITNLLVPGDLDGTANGQVQVMLDFPGADNVLDAATGKFIYKVFDQTTGAPLATNTFSVAQKVRTQGVRGRLTSAAGGFALTNVAVALSANGGPGGTMTVTDTNGNFSFYAPPASYNVVAVVPGFVSDENAGFVTVVTNQFVTNNLALAGASYYVAGKLSDAANSSKGIVGVFIQAESTNNLFSGAFTDTNGNFAILVSSNQWKIKTSEGDVAQHGYLGLQNNLMANVSSASVSNFNFSLPKFNALIYGVLTNTLGQPLGGISFSANDGSNTYSASGFSETNGFYTIGVVAGDWNANPNSDSLAAVGYLSGYSASVTVGSNQVVRADFVVQKFSSFLVGRALDYLGNPLANFNINANDNGSANSSAQTDSDGTFVLGVFGGTWNLNIGDMQQLAQMQQIGPQLTLNVTDGVSISNLVLVTRQAANQISGSVLDQGSNAVGGLNVYGSVQVNGTNYASSANTDFNGNYSLPVFNGSWQLSLDCNDLSQRGYNCPGYTNVNISGANGFASFIVSTFGNQLQVTTFFLPDATQGQPYNFQLQASGGQGTYSWDLDPFSPSLPAGLVLSTNGMLSGMSSSSGTFSFTVRVTDSSFNSAEQSLGLTIDSQFLLVATTSLPNALANTFYTNQLQASGGMPPYSWALSPGSLSLPNGLSLSSSGALSGKPTSNGTFYFVVRVSDSAFNSDDQSLGLIILPQPNISGAARVSGSQFRFTASGAPGLPSYNFQFSTNLTSWTTFLVTNAPNSPFVVTDTTATNKVRFYRIQMHF